MTCSLPVRCAVRTTTIKHMDKVALAAYLSRVWKRGYDAGYQAAVKSAAPQLREAAELKAANKEG